MKVRKRNIGVGKRKAIVNMANLSTKYDVSKLYVNNTFSSAHVVIQLSKRQAARLAPNSIHITQSVMIDKCVYYNNVVVGNGVNSNLKKINTSKGNIWTKIVSLQNMKNNLLAITTTFEEIHDDIGRSKVLVLDATNRTATNDYEDDKYQPSGIILLALIKMDTEYAGILEWNKDHHIIMHKHKKPLFDSDSKHHGSTGKYYSYGNKGNFGMVGLSSVGQYANRDSNHLSYYKGKCIEEISQMEMQCGIANLSRYLPVLPKLISPIIHLMIYNWILEI